MKLFLVIRTLVGSQWSCRRAVGENQSLGPLNPAGWNGHIARAQPREGRNFVRSGHEPQNAAGTVEDRIRQRHPTPPLVDLSQRDICVGDVQNRISGHQRSSVAVGSEAQMGEVKNRRQTGKLLKSQGVPLGCSL